jgi:hypothetical protein
LDDLRDLLGFERPFECPPANTPHDILALEVKSVIELFKLREALAKRIVYLLESQKPSTIRAVEQFLGACKCGPSGFDLLCEAFDIFFSISVISNVFGVELCDLCG